MICRPKQQPFNTEAHRRITNLRLLYLMQVQLLPFKDLCNNCVSRRIKRLRRRHASWSFRTHTPLQKYEGLQSRPVTTYGRNKLIANTNSEVYNDNIKLFFLLY